MKSDLIEKASLVITDPPVLINMVSQRVRQLNQGHSPLVQLHGVRTGSADIALMEIIAGKITMKPAPVAEVEGDGLL